MRRRRPLVPLDLPTLEPWSGDDASLPYPLRKKKWEGWMERRTRWVEAREVYAQTVGWPGGEYARAHEENETHPVPDCPFDPAWETAHGGL